MNLGGNMNDHVVDSSCKVRNTLWTRDGLTRWLEPYLRTAKTRQKTTKNVIRMRSVLRDVKTELMRTRFCVACGAQKRQSTQTARQWQKIYRWCDGDVDPFRCIDCGRSRPYTINRRCDECSQIWSHLEEIVLEVAERISVDVQKSKGKDLFAMAERANRTRRPPKREPLVPVTAIPRLRETGPKWGSAESRVMKPGARVEILRKKPGKAKKPTTTLEAILEMFGNLLADCMSEQNQKEKAVYFRQAWTAVVIEKSTLPQGTDSSVFINRMCDIWERWEPEGKIPNRASLRIMIRATDSCRLGRMDRSELLRTIELIMKA